MTDARQTCPSCGRPLPAGHALCVKCGAKLDDPSALTGPTARSTLWSRQRLIAAAVAVTVIAATAIGLWRYCGTRSKDVQPANQPANHAGQGNADAAVPSAELAAVDSQRPLDAGASPAPHLRPPGPPPGPHPGPPPGPHPGLAPLPDAGASISGPGVGRKQSFEKDLRSCVDQRRAATEEACRDARRYLGITAESLCLWSKIVARYWTCIKQRLKRSGRCLTRCTAVGTLCIASCSSFKERGKRESTAGCLMRCWRDRIDPCLGSCIRP